MFYDIKLFLFDSEQICKYCHTVVVVAATALTTTVTSHCGDNPTEIQPLAIIQKFIDTKYPNTLLN